AARCRLALRVRDTGIGIPADSVEKIFAPFTQADTSTTRNFGGTGLGLAICRELSTRMGGGITVTSTLGVGSTFTCTVEVGLAVPVRRTALRLAGLAALGQHQPGTKPATPKPAPGRSLRILVAEDNLVNQRVAALMLERLGYRADLVADGQQAVAAMLAQDYDLVLMDLHMPRLDGLAAARQAR